MADREYDLHLYPIGEGTYEIKGDTYKHRAILKAMRCRWCPELQVWVADTKAQANKVAANQRGIIHRWALIATCCEGTQGSWITPADMGRHYAIFDCPKCGATNQRMAVLEIMDGPPS